MVVVSSFIVQQSSSSGVLGELMHAGAFAHTRVALLIRYLPELHFIQDMWSLLSAAAAAAAAVVATAAFAAVQLLLLAKPPSQWFHLCVDCTLSQLEWMSACDVRH
jgi:hypothetical protein